MGLSPLRACLDALPLTACPAVPLNHPLPQNTHHSARLEWIIIILIAVELLVGVVELLGLFGLVKAS
jgi:hypothetical protein